MGKPTKTDAERLSDANDIIRSKEATIKTLNKELRSRSQVNDTAEHLRKEICGLEADTPEPPGGRTPASSTNQKTTGVPLIMASDWHWGETVDVDQTGGMNAFNRRIAKERVKIFGEAVIDLCFNHRSEEHTSELQSR